MAVTPRNCKIPRTSNGGGDDDDDRLSCLPEHIIHHIFSFLDTVTVVRASSVSRNWRYLFVSMPHLNFNLVTFWSHRRGEWSKRTANEKFKDFVNWVFLSQNWSVDIQRFYLFYPKIRDDNTICRWMNDLARRNVQQIYLKLFSGILGTPLELPLCIVNCESLVDLKIYFHPYNVLKLPEFPGFTHLKSLDLSKAEFLDSVLLKKFVSSCPVLESLTMRNCNFHDFKILDIAAPRLKNLIIDSLASAGEGLFNCEVIVACPSLVSFKLLGTPSSLSFPGTNGLQNVFIFFNHGPEHRTVEEGHHLMDSILRGICNIKVLKLSAAFLGFLNRAAKPKWFSTSFYNLKSLSLFVLLNRYKEVEPIINLLNLSPNLEAITILIDWMEWSECWEIPDEITCSAYHLKSVRLLDFGGSENELELLRFLLMKGVVLEKLSITWLEDVENHSEIIREIKKFPTSSSNVAFTFLKPRSNVCYGARFSDYGHDL